MSRKKKENAAKPATSSQVESFASEAPQQQLEPPVRMFRLKEVAEQYLVGFKSHWWPSIEAHAKNRGFHVEGSLEDCKVIIQDWSGGSAKFKI
jgi:hypothetical protein